MPSSRSTVNVPAAVGVAVVFLAAVVVWVVASNMGGDSISGPDTTTVVSTSDPAATTSSPATVADPTTVPPSTSPVPLPDTLPRQSTTTTVAVTTTTTTSPPQPPENPDLGIPGYPMQFPTCDGAFVTVLASRIGTDGAAASIKQVLDAYPDANYLRTDTSCASFTQSINGQPVFVVYFGPFIAATDACQARAQGTPDAYVKKLAQDPNAGGANCG